MIEILPQSSETCIGFKVSGKVTAEDYDVLLPKLDEAISAHGKINLLVVMGDFEGWAGLEAAKADFKLGTQQYRQVEKAAFVGDKKWQEWMVKIMDPFTRRTDERFFDLDQLEDAWQWVKEED
jgi:6-phosphofructokinase